MLITYVAAVNFTDWYTHVQCCCFLCVTDKRERESKAERLRCLSTLSNCLSSCDIDGLNSDIYCIGWQISTQNLTYTVNINIPDLPVGLKECEQSLMYTGEPIALRYKVKGFRGHKKKC